MILLNCYCSVCFRITIVSDAEGLALFTPPLPEGHESGLGNLSHDGGQMILPAAVEARKRNLGHFTSTITASHHSLTLEKKTST